MAQDWNAWLSTVIVLTRWLAKSGLAVSAEQGMSSTWRGLVALRAHNYMLLSHLGLA